MKSFITKKAWPLLAGFISASVTMMIFEYINHLVFPFPQGMDPNSYEQIRAFTDSLPSTAYLLVWLGWCTGSFIGSLVTVKLSKEKEYKLSLILGVVLFLAGIFNNIMIGSPMWFNIVSLPMFFVFTYLGFRFSNR